MNETIRLTKYLAENYPNTFIYRTYNQDSTTIIILETNKIIPRFIDEMRLNWNYNAIEITPKDKETIYIQFTRRINKK